MNKASVKDLLRSAKEIRIVDKFNEWDRECASKLNFLRENCCKKYSEDGKRIYTGNVQAWIASIARLEAARNKLQRKFNPTSVGAGGSSELIWLEIETAFKQRVSTGVVTNTSHIDPQGFLNAACNVVLEQVRLNLERHDCLKVNVILNGEFATQSKVAQKSIVTNNQQLFPSSDLTEWYEFVIEKILNRLEEFQERDSGWALVQILHLIVNINKCNLFHAGCWVKAPKWIVNKKATINVYSTDNACFAWAVMAALHPTLPGRKYDDYPHYSTVLNFEGIEFPVKMKQITKFERLNNMSVNVFIHRERKRRTEAYLATRSCHCASQKTSEIDTSICCTYAMMICATSVTSFG